MKPSFATLKTLTLALLIAVGVSYASAAYQSPSPNIAPDCPTSGPDAKEGCNPPLNVSVTAQAKAGALTLGATSVPNTMLDIFGNMKVGGNALFLGGVQITSGAGANKVLTSDASGNASWQTGGGGFQSTTLPGNPRYAFLQEPALASYFTRGVRAGGNGSPLANADTIQNIVYIPVNNILQVGKKYAYLLVTSGDSMGQRKLANGTLIPSRCYNSGHDPLEDPFLFSDIDGTMHRNAVFSHQGTFTYNPTTITSLDRGFSTQGVLIARNTISCSDAGKGSARIYVYETATLKSIMDALYNEIPVKENPAQYVENKPYLYSPKVSAYLYKDQP